MPYRYRCEQCRTTSYPVPTRAAAEAERDRHRAAAHGGHIPDGEQLLRDGAGGGSDRRGTAVAWGGVLLVLAAIGWLREHF